MPAVEDLPRLLARGESYPHRPRDVEVRETHVSWVFLAGERAYKLKKPLVLPFLDYGTPARRREMCRREVELNRRLAPGVYVGVRGVVASAEGVGLTEESDPEAIDYVVEMRRYDEDATLAAWLARGELELRDVDAVALRVLRFHEQARVIRRSRRWDAELERRLQRNLRELLECVEQRAELHRVLALERFTHAYVDAYADALRARSRGGYVRECHGDLRAEHVLLGEEVEIVDCLEFDPRLRELDVADELAFLVLDLTSRGGDRFARRLLEAYRRAGGDCGPDSLVAFYCVYRALVRAKVELLAAGQQRSGSAAHGHHSAAARELIGLGERFAWQARLPLAIVVCGVPAAGKTTLARELSAASRLPHVSSDVTRKGLACVGSSERAPAEAYAPDFNTLTYEALGRHAAAEVAAAGGVVVDATFRHAGDRRAFLGTFGAAAPVVFVECRAPVSVLLDRARRRDRTPHGASDADLPVVRREATAWDPLDEVAAGAHLTVRTDRDPAAVVADLVGLLDARLIPPPAAPGRPGGRGKPAATRG